MVAVTVALAVPGSVAALVNRNDIVKVIDIEKCSMPGDVDRHRRGFRIRLRSLITATASFPLTSAATIPGATTSTFTATTSNTTA